MTIDNFTVVVLAGGKSARMGADKAFVEYLGKPLIRYPLELAAGLNAGVLVSSNNPLLAQFGHPVVADLVRAGAPMAGIHASLRSAPTPWSFVVGCDMPGVTPGVVRRLATELDGSVKLVLPVRGTFIEPLCGFYHRSLAGEMETLMQEQRYGLLGLLQRVPHRLVSFDDLPAGTEADPFRNINERSDLAGPAFRGSATS